MGLAVRPSEAPVLPDASSVAFWTSLSEPHFLTYETRQRPPSSQGWVRIKWMAHVPSLGGCQMVYNCCLVTVDSKFTWG